MPWRSPNRPRSDQCVRWAGRLIVHSKRWRSAGVPLLPVLGLLGLHTEGRITPGRLRRDTNRTSTCGIDTQRRLPKRRLPRIRPTRAGRASVVTRPCSMSKQSPLPTPSQPASNPAAWIGAIGTKFRAPHLRRDVVERAALLHHAERLAMDSRLTLVCAPAGFGKSTLLAQLSARSGDLFEGAWLSIDEDDNDANRVFASVLRALRSVPLEWAVDQQALASQVDGIGPGSRAAVAGLIDALCSYQGERLLLFIDDLHRITDAGALRLIDDIIDRMPPEVGVVVGSRLEPNLALARWRARGELGELRMSDLQFDEVDARSFASARLSEAATPEFVQEVLERTDGWAAGLQLVFASAQSAARTTRQAVHGQGAARRHLFDFFAHEVLAELPPDLRTFILQCSVLPELTPTLCAAVSGRDDARDVLDDLYRRH